MAHQCNKLQQRWRKAVEQLAIAPDENLRLPKLAKRLEQLQKATLAWQSTRDALSAAELGHNRSLSAMALNG